MYLLLIGLLLACVSIASAQLPGLTHVILISLDGARPDALLQVDTPYIDSLVERGAVDWEAQTIFPPSTMPAHTSMLTGLNVEKHGIDWNEYRSTPIAVPTILLLAEEAGFPTAMVVGKEKLQQFHQSEAIDFTFARIGDRSVVDRALELLDEGYEVLFVHFPNPDFFGHSTGWMSGIYLYELGNTDRQIGRILDKLDELGITDETLLIITADHGGSGISHGLNIPENRTIPWIMAGPGVEPGTVLTEAVYTTDTAATILWALGLPLPEDLDGEPVYQAFSETAITAAALATQTNTGSD